MKRLIMLAIVMSIHGPWTNQVFAQEGDKEASPTAEVPAKAEKKAAPPVDPVVPAEKASAKTKKSEVKPPKAEAKGVKTDAKDTKKGKKMFAVMTLIQKKASGDVDLGKVKIKLFEKETPKTVENFAGLAEGKKEWTNPKTSKKEKTPFYDGLKFHRVIPDFMVQGGCPLGEGFGGPGYQFADEIVATLKHNKPGILSMANSGPGTNGSQFFVTVKATPWLDGKHTVFGEVESGMDIIEKISQVPRDPRDKPLDPVVIKKLEIVRE